EDGIRDFHVTGVQTCALPIYQRLLIKAQRALKECGIGGVETNLYFQRALLAHPDLAANKVFTRFIEEKGAELVAGAVALQEAEADRKSVVEGKRVGRGGRSDG